MRDKRRSVIVTGILLGASLLWCLWWFLRARGYLEDDAFIHLEFARSVAHGEGFAFNGHVVDGDTAPLWVLFLAAAHRFIPDWPGAAKVLAWVSALFAFAGLYAFARRIARKMLDERAAHIFPAAVVLLIAINPYTCYWMFSGMEAVGAAGLACWAVLPATREKPTIISLLLACLFAGLGTVLRPEMVLFAAILLFPIFRQWRGLDHASAAKAGFAIAGLILIAGPPLTWSLYSLHAFGHLLPNTNAAKRAASGDSVLLRLFSVYVAGLPALLAGATAALVGFVRAFFVARPSVDGLVRRCRQAGGDLPLEGWLFVFWALAATVFYVGDHTYVQTRYVLVPAFGLTVVVMAVALRRWPRREVMLYSAPMVAALCVSLAVVAPLIRNKAQNCATGERIAAYIRQQVPADAPVAAYSIGQIAFQSEHPIIDTSGIMRPEAIPHLSLSQGEVTHWAESEGARYYIAGAAPQAGSVPVFSEEMRLVGWTFPSDYRQSSPVSVWRLPAPAQR